MVAYAIHYLYRYMGIGIDMGNIAGYAIIVYAYIIWFSYMGTCV